MELSARYEHDITEGLHQPATTPKLVTEADIAHLPAAVQRYLVFTGALGRAVGLELSADLRRRAAQRPGRQVDADGGAPTELCQPAGGASLSKNFMLGVPFDAYHRYVGPRRRSRNVLPHW